MAVYRAVMSGLLFGQTTQNVAHFADGGNWSTQRATLLAQDLRDGFITQIRTRSVTGMRWNVIQVYDGLDPLVVPVTLVINITGTQTTFAAQCVPFACTIFRLRTLQAGPAGRGRLYLPGCPPGDFTSGVMDATVITAWQTILNVLGPRYTTDNATSTFKFVVAPRINPANFKAVLTLEIGTLMGTQRRRNIGVGI